MSDDLPPGFRVVGSPPAGDELPKGFRVVSASSAAPDPSRTPVREDGVPMGGEIGPGSGMAGVDRSGSIGIGGVPQVAAGTQGTWRRGTLAPVEKNTTTGELRLAVPQVALDAWDAFTLPGDVLQGKIDPQSPEGMRRTINLAGLAPVGVAAGASRELLSATGHPIPKSVIRGLSDDGIPFDEIAARVADLGPEGIVADLGPNLRDKAAALATTPGRAQATVVDHLRERQAGAPDRLMADLDEALGIAPVPSRVQRGIRADQREIGPEYDAVLANAAPVDTSTLASRLDTSIAGLRGKAQTELQNVRGMLNEVGSDNLDRSASTLFQVRRAIDGMLNAETYGNVRRVLGDARAEVDGILSNAAPGLKRIDAQYGELGRQHDAIDRGQTVLGSGRTDPRPVELADEAAEGVIPQGDIVGPSGVTFRLRQGARAEIDRLVGNNLNDRAALTSVLKGESDWNRQRLSTLFGEERTARLYRILENERAMAETENKALVGAKTASLHAAQREIDGPPKRPGVLRSAGNLRAGDAMAEIIDAAFRGASGRRRAKRNDRIAEALTGRGDFIDPGRVVPLGAGFPLTAAIGVNTRTGETEPSLRMSMDDEIMRAVFGRPF